MFCSGCGTQLVPQSAFCGKCGTPTGLAVGAVDRERPGVITILAVLHFIGATIWLLVGLFALAGLASSPPADQAGAIFAGVILIALGLLQVACGIGLWTLKPYGRTLQLVFGWIGLLGIPVGTVIAILILVYMYKPGIKALFSGKTAAEFTPAELASVAAVTQGSQAVTILVVLLVAIGSIAGIGILAAIAVPGLLRARMAGNEAAALARIRTLLDAERSYAAANGGVYQRPDLLEPTHPAALSQSAGGYSFRFHAGPGLTTFTYVAVPNVPGSTGFRSFCGDNAGVICSMSNGASTIRDGACPAGCAPVREQR